MNKTKRSQRRARAGLEPASLSAAYPISHDLVFVHQISRTWNLLFNCYL